MDGVNPNKVSEELVETNKEVEELLLEQANQRTQDPVETAAMMYGMYLPHFKRGLKQLSSRARSRVMNALVEYPLNEKKYSHRDGLEKELMAIGHAVLEAKFLMILATYNNGLEELANAANPEVSPLDIEDKEELSNFFNRDNIATKEV